MKNIKIIMGTLILSLSAQLYADIGAGNGGDHLKFMFIHKGTKVLALLKESKMAWMQQHNIDLDLLEQSLDATQIKIMDIPNRRLLDNGGSIVDATASLEEGITIDKSSWEEHFKNGRDVYYLILHEMLRTSGYSKEDDQYQLSQILYPFPNFNQVQEIQEWQDISQTTKTTDRNVGSQSYLNVKPLEFYLAEGVDFREFIKPSDISEWIFKVCYLNPELAELVADGIRRTADIAPYGDSQWINKYLLLSNKEFKTFRNDLDIRTDAAFHIHHRFKIKKPEWIQNIRSNLFQEIFSLNNKNYTSVGQRAAALQRELLNQEPSCMTYRVDIFYQIFEFEN